MKYALIDHRFRRACQFVPAMLSCVSVWMVQADPPPSKEWRPIGQLDVTRIPESSGIVKSRRHPDLFWTHNDSGHPAVLYAIRRDGRIVAEIPVEGATNSDWEDIAADSQGNLYLGDIGNNQEIYPQRYIYVIPEPDPFASPLIPARTTEVLTYRFPENERFDAESLVVLRGEIFIISKPRTGQAHLYHLARNGASLLEPRKVCVVPATMPTGADVSESGQRLAVCTVDGLSRFSINEKMEILADPPRQSVTFPRGKVEACCFDGQDVILTSESGGIYRITDGELEDGTVFRNKASPPGSQRP